jgi:hypothetical protein
MDPDGDYSTMCTNSDSISSISILCSKFPAVPADIVMNDETAHKKRGLDDIIMDPDGDY